MFCNAASVSVSRSHLEQSLHFTASQESHLQYLISPEQALNVYDANAKYLLCWDRQYRTQDGAVLDVRCHFRPGGYGLIILQMDPVAPLRIAEIEVYSGDFIDNGAMPSAKYYTMTSSNGNIFRVTGHLYGEFTGHRWIPHTKASDAELWCFPWTVPVYTDE